MRLSNFFHKFALRSTLDLFLNYCDLEVKSIIRDNTKKMTHRNIGDSFYSTAFAVLTGSNRQALTHILINPTAIAYVSIGITQKAIKRGARLKLLDLEGVAASSENVTNNTYPLRRSLNLITNGPPKGIIKEFINFLHSDEGKQIITNLNFHPSMSS